MDAYKQIDWLKQQILDQIDAGMEHFTMEERVLEFAKVVVNSCVGRVDVMHALHMYDYLHDIGALDNIKCKDRLQCLYEHFFQWVELELATRYA